MLHVIVDADGCPVREEIYRVARRCGLRVTLVANTRVALPPDPAFTLVRVGSDFDAADDWIALNAGLDDIVVTADVVLASRVLKTGARAIDPRGRLFTESSIGDALSRRDISAHLRDMGHVTGGPAPFGRRDRSLFLQRLDDVVQAVRRKPRTAPDA